MRTPFLVKYGLNGLLLSYASTIDWQAPNWQITVALYVFLISLQVTQSCIDNVMEVPTITKDPKAYPNKFVTKHAKHFGLPLVNWSPHLFVSFKASHRESKVIAFI